MGEEIAKTEFEPADFDRFAERLRTETDLAGKLFREKKFSEEGFTIGFDLVQGNDIGPFGATEAQVIIADKG